MRPRTFPFALIAAAALASPAADRADGAPGGAAAGPARADVRTVTGRIAALDAHGRTVTIETGDGPVALEFDRNTSVYLEDRLGTVRDLALGAHVRASFGPERLAYWIELRPGGAPAPGG